MRAKAKIVTLLFGTILIALIAIPASANNTTNSNAYSLVPNGTSSETFFNGTDQQRWYAFRAISGRSYCAETQGGVFFDVNAGNIDTVVNVFRTDGITSLVTNDDAVAEPRGYRLSRGCFIAAVSEVTYVQIVPFTAGDQFNFRVRIAETTLFSNWFFLGGDYSSFTLLRNTTSSTLSYTINWRNSAGTIVGTQTASLVSNASAALNGRDFPGALAAVSGTVEIVHNSTPDAIFATTTVLSGTTGLSFDTFFVKRASW